MCVRLRLRVLYVDVRCEYSTTDRTESLKGAEKPCVWKSQPDGLNVDTVAVVSDNARAVAAASHVARRGSEARQGAVTLLVAELAQLFCGALTTRTLRPAAPLR